MFRSENFDYNDKRRMRCDNTIDIRFSDAKKSSF